MNILARFKNVNKKWYILLTVVLLLGIGGSIAAKEYVRHHYTRDWEDRLAEQVAQEVSQDLIYLEKFGSLKIRPDQAKAMLPMVEQLAGAGDPPTQAALVKQIYGLMTPEQYATVLDKHKAINRETKENHRDDRDFRNKRDGDDRFSHSVWDFVEHKVFGRSQFGYQDPKQQALGDIVIKMLTTRSTEQPTAPNQ